MWRVTTGLSTKIELAFMVAESKEIVKLHTARS